MIGTTIASRRASGFGVFHAWSVTTWLIVINVAVFFIDGMLRRAAIDRSDDLMVYLAGPLERWGYFSMEMAIGSGQIWRFITFQFLHASPSHLVGNMLGMYFFGPVVEAHFGSRRFLAFYLISGLAGAASYLLLSAAHVLILDPSTHLVGASAGIFGLLVAAAIIAPDVQIYIYFLFPVTIRTLAFIGMAVAAYSVVAMGPMAGNAGGEAAHLGGGVLGFLLMKNQQWLNPFAPSRRRVAFAARRLRAEAEYERRRRIGARTSIGDDRLAVVP